MNPKRIQYAIDKLKVYAADDSIDAEHLAPIIAAYDSRSTNFLEACKGLAHYRACDSTIDELYDYAITFAGHQCAFAWPVQEL